jgi:pantoate--beta-alanine ligase
MAEARAALEMKIVEASQELRQQIAGWKSTGAMLGFVPTMGALHEGHLALVRRASELADKVVVSVFVNPTQFGPNEDFDKYPRDPTRDAESLQPAGCDLLFLPEVATIYPEGHCTYVDVEGVSNGFEGDHRPGHFRGVATVVSQLFNLVQPDVAVFGEKDAQQLAVVRRLVRDLHLPVEIEALATVREEDGLALSSRNAYLSTEDRQAATVLYRALSAAREAIVNGERSAASVRAILAKELAAESRLIVDYADVVDAESFKPVEYLGGRIVIPVAGRLGATRLLDNLQIDMNERLTSR